MRYNTQLHTHVNVMHNAFEEYKRNKTTHDMGHYSWQELERLDLDFDTANADSQRKTRNTHFYD